MSNLEGSKTGSFNLLPDVWRLSLNAAQNEKDLVVAVREYLATWTPEELAQLREDCRPGRITSGDDISDMAYRLSQVRIASTGTPQERALFERMMGIFLHASARYSQIAAKQRRPRTEPDG